MPLRQLVEYFNDRFALEYGFNFNTLSLEGGLVSGFFGPMKINSTFTPFRQTIKPELTTGYIAHLNLKTYDPLSLNITQLENLLANEPSQKNNFESIINFDRLSRTVHMLNYLTISHLQQPLFLEVDPRHILGVKENHGAYFEEIIHKCGLETDNVVIVTTVLNTYGTPYYDSLQTGLHNYQQRGYRIGLRFNQLTSWEKMKDYVVEFAANYVIFSVRDFEEHISFKELAQKLGMLKKQFDSKKIKIILRHIDEKRTANIAYESGVDWVEGNFYRNIAFDYRRHLKIDTYRPEVFNH